MSGPDPGFKRPFVIVPITGPVAEVASRRADPGNRQARVHFINDPG